MKQSEQLVEMADNLNPRIACLIHLYIFEALTPAQQEELDNWVNENESNRRTFMTATNGAVLMDGFGFLEDVIPENSKEKPLDKIKQKLHFEQPVQPEQSRKAIKLFHYRRWIAAASIIFVLGVGVAVYMSSSGPDEIVPPDISPGKSTATLNFDGSNVQLDQSNNRVVDSRNSYSIVTENGHVTYTAGTEADEQVTRTSHVISTPNAGTYSMILSDGTKVWLNPSSSITFPPVFPGHERKVTITGEAFFEVAQVTIGNGHKKPFIVEVKERDVRIEVLGTHFNINAYEDEPSVKTTLLEGSVKVVTTAQTTLLKPGQQAEINSSAIDVTDVGITGAEAARAWKEGNFDFQKSEIQALLREIGRWYDMEIVYETPMETRHFGGLVTRNTKLSEVLQALKLNGITSEIRGKKIVVTAIAKKL